MAKFYIRYIEVSFGWLSVQLISGKGTAATLPFLPCFVNHTGASPHSTSCVCLCILDLSIGFQLKLKLSKRQQDWRVCEDEDPEDKL